MKKEVYTTCKVVYTSDRIFIRVTKAACIINRRIMWRKIYGVQVALKNYIRNMEGKK